MNVFLRLWCLCTLKLSLYNSVLNWNMKVVWIRPSSLQRPWFWLFLIECAIPCWELSSSLPLEAWSGWDTKKTSKAYQLGAPSLILEKRRKKWLSDFFRICYEVYKQVVRFHSLRADSKKPLSGSLFTDYLPVTNYVLSKLLHKAPCWCKGDKTTLKNIHFNWEGKMSRILPQHLVIRGVSQVDATWFKKKRPWI